MSAQRKITASIHILHLHVDVNFMKHKALCNICTLYDFVRDLVFSIKFTVVIFGNNMLL